MQRIVPDRMIATAGRLRMAVAIGRTCAATAALGIVFVALVGVADRPPAAASTADRTVAATASALIHAPDAKTAIAANMDPRSPP